MACRSCEQPFRRDPDRDLMLLSTWHKAGGAKGDGFAAMIAASAGFPEFANGPDRLRDYQRWYEAQSPEYRMEIMERLMVETARLFPLVPVAEEPSAPEQDF